MYLYSYNQASEGAKALSKALGIKRIKHEGSKFKGLRDKTVINWGSSSLPDEVLKCKVLNQPEDVRLCTNKLDFFNVCVGTDVRTPDWTHHRENALSWVKNGHLTVARTILNGHSGQGIVLIESEDQMVDAPLYTVYVPKKDEYRVHVIGGEVVDVQQKKKKNDFEGEVNWKIRNLQNGFIYARTDVLAPDECLTQAKAVIALLGLAFGAVDIIWNEKEQKAYVLEVNTAPGLQGTTLEIYANKLGGLK